MQIQYAVFVTAFALTNLIITNIECSDFENLSYGKDVLSGKVTPTQKPIETTTKKSGFFSGFKKFFGGGKSTTETPGDNQPTSSTTPASVKESSSSSVGISTSTTTVKPDNVRDFVSPVRPTNIEGNAFNTVSTSSTTTSKPGNARDYIAPVRPAPPANIGGAGFGQSLPKSTVKPENQRDYVAPTRPISPQNPQAAGTPTNNINYFASTTASPIPNYPSAIPPSNRRDYVNPNIPTPLPKRSDSPNFSGDDFPSLQNNKKIPPPVPPKPGSPNPSPPVPQRPASPNVLDNKDFPPLGPPKGGNQKPNSVPQSTTPKPGDRVSFVPHAPGTASKTGTKNQLAKDDEITTLTESLISKDVNNQNGHITINLQGKTKSTDRTDEAPDKLLDVKDEALASPTIAKMRLLFNNYEIDTSINEYVTPIEHKEENDFVDAVMATSVMKAAMLFLQNKGIVTPDPKTHRDYVKTLWFTLYSRGGGRIGSSAFEHVFLNEIKNGTVIGMHNWVYFSEEEKLGHVDYKGYIREVDLGTKGKILKFRFNYNGLEKYANSLFVGTSPELEMALYTVCFAVRPDLDCPISLSQKKFNIVTHTWKYRGKQLIGSAYPEI